MFRNSAVRPNERIRSMISSTSARRERGSRWTLEMSYPAAASAPAVASPMPLEAPRIAPRVGARRSSSEVAVVEGKPSDQCEDRPGAGRRHRKVRGSRVRGLLGHRAAS